MILQDTVQIKSPPESVWRFIEDPAQMKRWNPKIQKTTPISWGDRHKGYRYRLTYVLGNRASDFLAEIAEYEKPTKLVIRLTEGNLAPDGYVCEAYELSGNDNGTLLRQRIEIKNVEINVFLKLLMIAIHHLGSPVGKKYLVRLKELAEGKTD